MSFNTAIARLMELVNTMYRYLDAKGEKNISLLAYAAEVLSLLMAPFAPLLQRSCMLPLAARRIL